jgi:isopenicillin N synthase-like dioxygenase
MEQKMTISYECSAAFRGYMPLGVENTEGKIDGREQIEPVLS